jgi:hypothetical protein
MAYAARLVIMNLRVRYFLNKSGYSSRFECPCIPAYA